jgi:putative membrane protein
MIFQNKKFSILFIFMVMFLFNSSRLAAVILHSEKIRNYEVTVQINKNGTLTVNEVIDYQFGEEFKHGIYRDIPLRSKRFGFDVHKSFIKMNWIKRDGEDEEYTKNHFYEGIRYRIGSETELVNLYRTESRYELNYDIYNAVFEKDGIYQVYYNAIGQLWNVPIEQASVIIRFPDGQKIKKNEIEKLEVYTGSYGEKGENYDILENDEEIHISTKELEAKNGLTFMLNLKTDKISPTLADKLRIVYFSNPATIILPFLLLFLTIYSIVTWNLFGRDPQGKSVIPEFNLPKDISPMFAAYINGERDTVEILNAGIFTLLAKGFIVANRVNGEIKYNKGFKTVYTQETELAEEERMLLDALSSEKNNIFGGEKRIYNKANSIIEILKDKYHKIIYKNNGSFLVPFYCAAPVFIIFIFSQTNFEFFNPFIILYILITLGSFFHRIWITVSKKLLIGLIIIAILGVSFYQGIEIFVFVAYFVILFITYSKLIGKYTNEGLRKKEYLKGMKMYIKTAEENQIRKFDNVKELIEYFNGILPFAVALGVKNEAIKLMKKTIKIYNFDINESYINSHTHIYAYSNHSFTNAFSRSYSSGRSKIMSEKFSSSKSGSGGGGFFSGGGFSGGGSGGGGGGSW